jgi:hypothetical protein
MKKSKLWLQALSGRLFSSDGQQKPVRPPALSMVDEVQLGLSRINAINVLIGYHLALAFRQEHLQGELRFPYRQQNRMPESCADPLCILDRIGLPEVQGTDLYSDTVGSLQKFLGE